MDLNLIKMKTINNYFDKIYCINLRKRSSRWERVKSEFEKHNLIVDGYTQPKSNILKPGEVGCLLSHLEIIKNAKNTNLKNILITEDDVEFDIDLNRKFFEYENELPENWDMLYLGANHGLCNPYEPNPPIKITEHVYKVRHAYSTHAYAINFTSYDCIINHIEKMTRPLDVMYSQIQSSLNVYLFRPHIAWQINGYSDIMETEVDYSFLKN